MHFVPISGSPAHIAAIPDSRLFLNLFASNLSNSGFRSYKNKNTTAQTFVTLVSKYPEKVKTGQYIFFLNIKLHDIKVTTDLKFKKFPPPKC